MCDRICFITRKGASTQHLGIKVGQHNDVIVIPGSLNLLYNGGEIAHELGNSFSCYTDAIAMSKNVNLISDVFKNKSAFRFAAIHDGNDEQANIGTVAANPDQQDMKLYLAANIQRCVQDINDGHDGNHIKTVKRHLSSIYNELLNNVDKLADSPCFTHGCDNHTAFVCANTMRPNTNMQVRNAETSYWRESNAILTFNLLVHSMNVALAQYDFKTVDELESRLRLVNFSNHKLYAHILLSIITGDSKGQNSMWDFIFQFVNQDNVVLGDIPTNFWFPSHIAVTKETLAYEDGRRELARVTIGSDVFSVAVFESSKYQPSSFGTKIKGLVTKVIPISGTHAIYMFKRIMQDKATLVKRISDGKEVGNHNGVYVSVASNSTVINELKNNISGILRYICKTIFSNPEDVQEVNVAAFHSRFPIALAQEAIVEDTEYYTNTLILMDLAVSYVKGGLKDSVIAKIDEIKRKIEELANGVYQIEKSEKENDDQSTMDKINVAISYFRDDIIDIINSDDIIME